MSTDATSSYFTETPTPVLDENDGNDDDDGDNGKDASFSTK